MMISMMIFSAKKNRNKFESWKKAGRRALPFFCGGECGDSFKLRKGNGLDEEETDIDVYKRQDIFSAHQKFLQSIRKSSF